MGGFGEALARNLADRWAAVAAPALAFWAAGIGAYALAHPGTWTDFRRWFDGLGSPLQLAVVAAALLGVAMSVAAVEWLVLPATRALEGYWPLLSRLQWRLNRRRARDLETAQARWDALIEPVQARTATWKERQEFAAVDAGLRRVPASEGARMPTRLGDLLRAAELWPQVKYGLEPIACFPRLWLVLPDSARKDLGGARDRLDRAVGVWIWAALLVVWTPWVWWAPLVGVALMLVLYRTWILTAASAYADLLEAAYDVYRGALYDAVGIPRPQSPAEERTAGEQLTAFLWRGAVPPRPGPTPVPRQAGESR